ncbi:LuxR C-terminal-related transcriptional regulator [Enterobacter oligotrophicus]|uniref:LuxR C-terminal-related transcriptional regulator n=1 Tax=Enterobacter oligotrophicus TaxID=2478464 RepID=UPI001260606B|nr:LuxR C-terminal-related transcriptional regulator [Enterobacter oligotrophicus]
MASNSETTQPINIALMGGDHYARHGITTLLRSVNPDSQIKISVGDYQQLDTALSSNRIDILLVSGAEKYHTGYDCLKYIKNIKANYPEVIICMYSAPANSLLWVRGDIDAYISLQDPIYQWRAKLLKMVDSRHRPKKKPAALSLTPGEWRVLKEIRNGLDIRYIAELEKLSYRRVSALKSSAIRKLGLRNKTDLLVFLTS